MDSGFYAACTGLLAETDALEVTANNMANLNTTGYKGQLEFYRSLEASMAKHRPQPSQSGRERLWGAGRSGGGPEDRGIPEDRKRPGLGDGRRGFFVVKTPAGIRYTRNGNFHTDAAGNLLTATGDAVMGDQGPVQLPGGTITISSDGTISQGGAVVATLKLVTFTAWNASGGGGQFLLQAPAGSEQPADDPRLAQGTLESSNLNPVSGTISLITLQRHAQLLEQALSIFHSVFNNAPAQDLSRVS